MVSGWSPSPRLGSARYRPHPLQRAAGPKRGRTFGFSLFLRSGARSIIQPHRFFVHVRVIQEGCKAFAVKYRASACGNAVGCHWRALFSTYPRAFSQEGCVCCLKAIVGEIENSGKHALARYLAARGVKGAEMGVSAAARFHRLRAIKRDAFSRARQLLCKPHTRLSATHVPGSDSARHMSPACGLRVDPRAWVLSRNSCVAQTFPHATCALRTLRSRLFAQPLRKNAPCFMSCSHEAGGGCVRTGFPSRGFLVVIPPGPIIGWRRKCAARPSCRRRCRCG